MKSSKNLILVVLGAVVAGILVFLLTKPGPEPTRPAASSAPPVASAAPRESEVPHAPPIASARAAVDAGASAAPVDLGMALLAAKKVEAARAALAAGDAKKALAEIEEYQRMPEATALSQEAVLVKIEALAKVGGRKTDAVALAMSTRDDPSYAPYQDRIQAILSDAGF
jgi:hypothetical protein